ncbi:MAG: type II secretion system F family protein [archaeon]
MKFKVPFTISNIEVLKKRSKPFIKFTGTRKNKLDIYLRDSGEDISRRQYLSICYRSFLLNLLIFSVLATSALGVIRVNYFFYIGVASAFLISGFVLFNQINYPRIFNVNKSRDLEKNLISVLQDMLVQLNSGVPIFNILLNISNSDYGEVSGEFKKITKEINSGVPQIEALESHGKINNSIYFKRILWQISNGMRAGSDMTAVIEESVRNLNDEQSIQIQSYGSKLNPIVMFYMLIAIVLPSLGITFLIIIASILGLPKGIVQLIFMSIFGMVLFMQIMFLGLIKSRRPSLL